MSTPSRRRFLSLTTLVGSVAAAGCLRLTDDDAGTDSTEQATEDSDGSSGDAVRLTREWSVTDLSGSDQASNVVAWRYDDSVLVGRYRADTPDRVSRIERDGTEVWTASDVPDTHTVYRSSVAADGRYVVFGFPRESRRTFQPDAATDAGGLVRCHDAESGREVWSFETEAGTGQHFVSSVEIATDGVVTVTVDGSPSEAGSSIYGVDLESGERRWRQPDLPPEEAVPRITDSVTHGGRCVVSTFYGAFALDADSGEVVDQNRSPRFPYFDLRADGEFAYGTDTSVVAKFDLGEFESVWETELSGGNGSNCEIGDDSVFVDDRNGYVYSHDKQTGEENWRQRVEGKTVDTALSSRHLWVSDANGNVYGYRRDTGAQVFGPAAYSEKSSAAGEQVPLVGLDDAVFVGGTESGQFRIESGDG
jgi:outer membrane protein assembly factor BamB